MSLRYGCTVCGRCCHDLRLTLSIDEALRWIDRGGTVEILCDGLPVESDFTTAEMAQYRARAFCAQSGSLAIVVNLLLVATYVGPCPNLQPDMLCGDYEHRPNTCRIYPAEIVPGRIPKPEEKRCPPEAWAPSQPALFDAQGEVADTVTRVAIAGARRAQAGESGMRSRLADRLGIDAVALRHEGFAAFRIDSAMLHSALLYARDSDGEASSTGVWHLVTPSERTHGLVVDAGGIAATPQETPDRYYIGLA